MGRSINDESLRPTHDQGSSTERSPRQISRQSREQDAKSVYEIRSQRYRLNSDQSRMLQDLGAFRTITTNSLRKHLYDNNDERFRKDLRSLREQRLLTVQPGSRTNGEYVALTKTGKELTQSDLRSNRDQVVYSGIVKQRELRHDAAIYDVYQKEARKISKAGGTPKRVVLDFELKKRVNRQLVKIQTIPPAERERQRQEIAEAHGLKIVEGKIQFPDVRIEFESRDQEQCKVDLECVTGHYKARQIAAKAAAGFKLYNQDYRGRSAERGEDLIGEVMSL
jgi:hypothetical protein